MKILIMQNAHQSTAHILKNYVDQVLNKAINYYNSTLTTAYNRIATLEVEIICFQGELTKLSRGNITSKAKVPELLTFAGSENKMQLHNQLNQIALYYLVSGIIVDNQKIICGLTYLHTSTSIYMKAYYNKVQAGQSI